MASGQVVKTVDTTLDWMYEGPAAQSEQSTEEYLLGKIYKPKESQASELKDMGENIIFETNVSNMCLCIAQKPGSLWMNKISSKNDTFTRLHEDPMLLIKKNEKEVCPRCFDVSRCDVLYSVVFQARENVINNPVKMARIRHALAADLETKKMNKQKKKDSKKESKKEPKKERQSQGEDRADRSGRGDKQRDRNDYRDDRDSSKRQRRHYSSSSSRSRSGERRYDQERSGYDKHRGDDNSRHSRDGSGKLGRDDFRDRDKDRDRHRSGGNERSRESRGYGSRGGAGRKESRSPSRSRSRSRSHSRSPYTKGSDRKSFKAPSAGHPSSGSGASEVTSNGRHAASDSRPHPGENKQYGLVKNSRGASHTADSSKRDPSHLGPNMELLSRKKEEAEREERERLARLRRSKGGVSNHMDDAEKERRLKEMMADAVVNDDIRSRRHKPSDKGHSAGTSSTGHANDDEAKEGQASVSKGAFLRDMRSQVYKSETEGGTSMEETLSRTRHYHQKGSDLDSHGFMKR